LIELPAGIDINNLIDDIRILSWEASDVLLYYSKILKDSNFKKNILKNNDIDDPVTLADLKVNETVIKRINDKYKDVEWQILSEENVKTKSNDCNINSDWLWILDPLDGTKDFIQGTSNYAMHLALNYKQKTFLGIVLIPERDELWIAYEGLVWCEQRNGSKNFVKRSTPSLINEMTLVTSKNHRNLTLKNLIERINFAKVIEMGSVGCKIASLLRGEADIYICLSLPGKSSPKDWDFAAPAAVLEAAGGAITNLDNQELTYGKLNFLQGGVIVASMYKTIHGTLCNQIKDTIKKFNLYPL
tara:strand:- start:318 stop:1220 length:903 start_codon:yes stop_codon:yes gene_type:complete